MTDATDKEDNTLIRRILAIKLAASSAAMKLSKVGSVPNGWELNDSDNDLTVWAIKIRLGCEYAIAELEAICDICEDMIHRPPSYVESNTGFRRHKAIELSLLLERARKYLKRLEKTMLMFGKSYSANGEDVVEAGLRVQDAMSELDEDELDWDASVVDGTVNGSIERSRPVEDAE